MGDPRYRLNVDFDNTIIPFLYNTTGQWTFTVPAAPNFMGSRYVVFLPAVMVLNEVDKIPAISGYSRIEGGIPLTGEFRTIAAADYNTLLLKDAIEFPAASAGATLTMTNFYTVGSTVEIDAGIPIVEINSNTALASNSIYIINASAEIILTLPSTALQGEQIKIIDTTGFGFKLKRNNFNTQTLLFQKGVLLPVTSMEEYLENFYDYSVFILECVTANTKWQEINEADVNVIKGKGYGMGGNTGSPLGTATMSAVIEDIDFVVETSAPITATLNTAKAEGAGVSSSVKGYCMGGFTSASADVNVIEDLIFSDESSSVITATLNTAKGSSFGVQSSLKGYCMGGNTGSNSTPVTVTVIEDMDFSDDSSDVITSVLSAVRQRGASFSSSTFGFICAGYANSVVPSASFESIEFSDETVTAMLSVLPVANIKPFGLSGITAGFVLGGDDDFVGTFTAIYKMVYSTEIVSTLSEVLGTGRNMGTGINGAQKGYCIGGVSGLTPPSNIIDSFNYVTEIQDVLSATLNTARWGHAGVSGIAS